MTTKNTDSNNVHDDHASYVGTSHVLGVMPHLIKTDGANIRHNKYTSTTI